MISYRNKAAVLLALLLIHVCGILLFQEQFILKKNIYSIVEFHEQLNIGYWALLVIWLTALAILFPSNVEKPSDIFLIIYLIGTASWAASYWPATGIIKLHDAILLGMMIVLPAIIITAIKWMVNEIKYKAPELPLRLNRKYLTSIIIIIMMGVAINAYLIAGKEGSFGNDYTRRLSARLNFEGHMIVAYLFQMSTNGLAPFLAYLSGQRRSWKTFVIALGFAIYCYWLLALKSPVVNVMLMAALGYLINTGKINNFGKWMLNIVATTWTVATLENIINGHSFIADHLIRRVALVTSNIQVYFYDALARIRLFTEPFKGIDLINYTTPEYYIGAVYMNNRLTNANTNAFFHQAAKSGLWGYLLVVAGVSMLLIMLDIIQKNSSNRDGFAIAAIAGILLTEQAFGIVMVSSGVLLCFALSQIFSHNKLTPEIERNL